MKRLTRYGTLGEVWIVDNDETRRVGRTKAAFIRLAEFEDLGITPKGIRLLSYEFCNACLQKHANTCESCEWFKLKKIWEGLENE